MARCPFAVWRPISGSCGPHLGGPFKIVHHTTEGSSARGAFAAFAANRSDPHFTVDATTIYQHIDTDEAARALRNDPGGVQTNRDSAVQIELVGFAHLPKDRNALQNVARLCRWIEATHGVPNVWPSGLPKTAVNGRDPGAHNRNAVAWDTQSGHFGHCHVPENSHWDPGYSPVEVEFLMEATFDEAGRMTGPAMPALAARVARGPVAKARPHEHRSTMPDHGVVPRGMDAYLRDLPLAPPPPVRAASSRRSARKSPAVSASATSAACVVNAGSLLAFVDGVTQAQRQAVILTLQLAQRAANAACDRFIESEAWYRKYIEVLQNLGWGCDALVLKRFQAREASFRMDRAALGALVPMASQEQVAALATALGALEQARGGDAALSLFAGHAMEEGEGNFQLGAVQRSAQGPTLALCASFFRGLGVDERFLFASTHADGVHLWTGAQTLTLNMGLYARRRAAVVGRLADDAAQYVAVARVRRK